MAETTRLAAVRWIPGNCYADWALVVRLEDTHPPRSPRIGMVTITESRTVGRLKLKKAEQVNALAVQTAVSKALGVSLFAVAIVEVRHG